MEMQHEILEKIRNAVKQEANFELENVDMNIKLDEMGIDSLNRVAVLVSLGKTYKFRIPELETVGELVEYIHENRKV